MNPKIVDNCDLILPLLNFDEGSHHLFIKQRSKDGHGKAENLIAEWFVSSQEKLELLLPAVKVLCKEYSARAYLNINPKPTKKVLWNVSKITLNRLESDQGGFANIVSSAHDQIKAKREFKYWILDIDEPFDIAAFTSDGKYIELYNNHELSEFFVAFIPTINGYHMITKPFQRNKFNIPKTIQIKDNNATLLYAYIN